MLIIFDLDDTLLDTSKYLAPLKLKEVYESLFFAGLSMENDEKEWSVFLKIYHNTNSTKEAVNHFIELKGGSSRYQELAHDVLTAPLPQNVPPFLRKGAKKVLHHLKKQHHMAIVTVGDERLQKDKLKRSGMDCSLFCNIVISKEANKKPCYEKIVLEKNILPDEVLVCGDRILGDLKPAKELGFQTVHVRYGRGKKCQDGQEYVDHTIVELKELKELLP